MILMELVRDGTVTLKNIDHTINEMMGMSVSQTSVKSVTKNDNLGNLSNSLEQLASQENENRENSSDYLEKKKYFIVVLPYLSNRRVFLFSFEGFRCLGSNR